MSTVSPSPAIAPDLVYTTLDNSLRPSWRANSLYVNEEHKDILAKTGNIAGWQLEGDSYKLYEMAYFAGDVILEIGTYSGRSAVVELLGAKANPARTTPAKWYGVDLDPTAVDRTRTTLTEWGLVEHATPFYGDSAKFLEQYGDIRPTMAFVDGDHEYAGVLADLKRLSGTVLGPGVPVLCHDYLNPTTPGVKQGSDEWASLGHAKYIGSFGCSGLFLTQ